MKGEASQSTARRVLEEILGCQGSMPGKGLKKNYNNKCKTKQKRTGPRLIGPLSQKCWKKNKSDFISPSQPGPLPSVMAKWHLALLRHGLPDDSRTSSAILAAYEAGGAGQKSCKIKKERREGGDR